MIKDTFLALQLRESRRTKSKRHSSVVIYDWYENLAESEQKAGINALHTTGY